MKETTLKIIMTEHSLEIMKAEEDLIKAINAVETNGTECINIALHRLIRSEAIANKFQSMIIQPQEVKDKTPQEVKE